MDTTTAPAPNSLAMNRTVLKLTLALLAFLAALGAVVGVAFASQAQRATANANANATATATARQSATATAPQPTQAQSLAIAGPCPCPFDYVRTSVNYAVAKGDTHVEADTDAGQPITVTLPAAPSPLERHEIWLTDQPGTPNGSLTIDTNGQAAHLPAGVSLTIPATSPNEGLVLLFVQPQPPPAGGYWRVSRL